MVLFSYSFLESGFDIFSEFPFSDPVKDVGIFSVLPLPVIVGEVYDSEGVPQAVSAITEGLVVIRAAWLFKNVPPTERLQLNIE